MSLDELQQAWQSQPASRIRVDGNALLAQLRRNQRSFKSTLFWRDFREVAIALALIPVFWSAVREQGWHWLSFCAACAWIAGYILVDRWRRRGRKPAKDQSLSECLDHSIDEVEHQIWLLRNVFWWYLLPGALAAIFTFGWIAATATLPLPPRLISLAGGLGIFAVVYAGIYWINQVAVRDELAPRRQELLALRESLSDGDDRDHSETKNV
jgi:hypothetical protein